HLRGVGGEAILLLLVEIDLVHRAAERVRGMAGKIAGLLAMRRIVIDLLLLDDEVRKGAVALVAEEERLAAVGDEDEAVMGDLHRIFPLVSRIERDRSGEVQTPDRSGSTQPSRASTE